MLHLGVLFPYFLQLFCFVSRNILYFLVVFIVLSPRLLKLWRHYILVVLLHIAWISRFHCLAVCQSLSGVLFASLDFGCCCFVFALFLNGVSYLKFPLLLFFLSNASWISLSYILRIFQKDRILWGVNHRKWIYSIGCCQEIVRILAIWK